MRKCPECDHLHELMNEYDHRGDLEHQAIRRELSAALTSIKEAVIKAETASDKRFESINEFRAQLGDQAATFISRNEYGAQHEALAEKLSTDIARTGAMITELTRRLDRISGSSAGRNAMYGWIIAAVGALATVMTVVLIATR